MTETWFLASKNAVVGGRLRPAWVEIAGETIQAVLDRPPAGFAGKIIDLGEQALLPGLVDTHVHINEPGRTEWEGFTTATHAAAAGGITTLVDMPLNCIPVTTSAAAFREKLAAVQGKLWVDAGFWGGAVAGNLAELPALLESGVLGVKTFLVDSGIPEFPPLTLEGVARAMPLLAERGMPYLFHAELDQGETPAGPSYADFLRSRPKSWENAAIAALIALARKHRAKTHIVHLSSADALASLESAKTSGVTITAETCPHYLVLSDRDAETFEPAAERTLFKCCPPIRENANREALWEGLLKGTIDMVVSDHSPCTPALKGFGRNDFREAWGGISSLQYTLSLLHTEGEKFSVTLPQLARWLSEAPAKLAGLAKKGEIARGRDADFVVFAPDARWTITKAATHHRHKSSPYLGRELRGKVERTILRGQTIFAAGKFANAASGNTLLRGDDI